MDSNKNIIATVDVIFEEGSHPDYEEAMKAISEANEDSVIVIPLQKAWSLARSILFPIETSRLYCYRLNGYKMELGDGISQDWKVIAKKIETENPNLGTKYADSLLLY